MASAGGEIEACYNFWDFLWTLRDRYYGSTVDYEKLMMQNRACSFW
jgi:hypothetical protein